MAVVLYHTARDVLELFRALVADEAFRRSGRQAQYEEYASSPRPPAAGNPAFGTANNLAADLEAIMPLPDDEKSPPVDRLQGMRVPGPPRQDEEAELREAIRVREEGRWRRPQ